jgi:hypothetical protein
MLSALVLVSVLVADAQTDWGERKTYRTLGAERVVTPERVEKSLGVVYTKEHFKLFFVRLPSPKFWEVRDNVGLGLLKKYGYVFVPVSPAMVSQMPEPWLVMRDPIPESLNEDWYAHKERASGQKRMPTREEVMWFVEVLWKVLRREPFKDVYVRTSTPSILAGEHVCLGENEAGILKIVNCADEATFIKTKEGRVPIALAPVAQR